MSLLAYVLTHSHALLHHTTPQAYGNSVHTQFMDLSKRRDSGYAGPPGEPTTDGSSSDDTYGQAPGNNPNEYYYNGRKWIYHGCWTDQSEAHTTRALVGYSSTSDHRTVEGCLRTCSDQDPEFHFAGLEYSKECFCGYVIESFSAPTATCDMQCSSGNGQICGGGNALTMYKIEGAPNDDHNDASEGGDAQGHD